MAPTTGMSDALDPLFQRHRLRAPLTARRAYPARWARDRRRAARPGFRTSWLHSGLSAQNASVHPGDLLDVDGKRPLCLTLEVKGALDRPRARTSGHSFPRREEEGLPVDPPRPILGMALAVRWDRMSRCDRPRVQSHDGGRAAPPSGHNAAGSSAWSSTCAGAIGGGIPAAMPRPLFAGKGTRGKESSRARSPCGPRVRRRAPLEGQDGGSDR